MFYLVGVNVCIVGYRVLLVLSGVPVRIAHLNCQNRLFYSYVWFKHCPNFNSNSLRLEGNAQWHDLLLLGEIWCHGQAPRLYYIMRYVLNYLSSFLIFCKTNIVEIETADLTKKVHIISTTIDHDAVLVYYF